MGEFPSRCHHVGRTAVAAAREPLGFTVIELLVVTAIVGVLVGLMLPAVQSVRETSRQLSCSNRLRQISLASQNYHAAFQRLPSGYVSHPTRDGSVPEHVINHVPRLYLKIDPETVGKSQDEVIEALQAGEPRIEVLTTAMGLTISPNTMQPGEEIPVASRLQEILKGV